VIAIAASRTLQPTPELVAVLAGLIASNPEGVAIRCDSAGDPTSPIEYLTKVIAKATGRHIFHFLSEANLPRSGWNRDYKVAEAVDMVIAFFPIGEEMTGGTGHLVMAALARGVAVEAYTFDEDGELVLIGSDIANPNRVRMGSRPDILTETWTQGFPHYGMEYK
jgi:hypothetical protein